MKFEFINNQKNQQNHNIRLGQRNYISFKIFIKFEKIEKKTSNIQNK